MEQVVLQLQNSTTRKKQPGIDVNFVKEFGDLGNKTLKNYHPMDESIDIFHKHYSITWL